MEIYHIDVNVCLYNVPSVGASECGNTLRTEQPLLLGPGTCELVCGSSLGDTADCWNGPGEAIAVDLFR